MADTKISAMGAAAALDGTEVIPGVQSGGNVKVPIANFGAITPLSEAGSTRTLALTDIGDTITYSAACDVTIPPNASVAFPIGTEIRHLRTGTGLVALLEGAGVTLRKPAGIKPAITMGALVKFGSDPAGANYTTVAAIPYNAEEYDTHTFHDNSTNPSRLSIPSGFGIKKVSLGARVCVLSTATVEDFSIFSLTKNAGPFLGGGASAHDVGAASVNLNIHTTAPTTVIAGTDYFENTLVIQTDTSVVIDAARSSFGIEVTEIDAQGHIVYQYGWVTTKKIGTNEWVIYGPGLG